MRNVPAGTLVSTEIVNDFYDFYVASQTSSKGSTLPNYYKVIHSDSNMEEGILQELVFSQCFNYVNWTGSIKVPGILQYASKCAKFSSEVLENEQLCDHIQKKLYFVWFDLYLPLNHLYNIYYTIKICIKFRQKGNKPLP